jgi:signal transduction histidine kinase
MTEGLQVSRKSSLGAATGRSTIVGATLVLVFFVFVVGIMLYAIRGLDASYEDLDSLLDRSVRTILRNEDSIDQIQKLKLSTFAFIDRLGRIAAKSDMRQEKDELETLWSERRFSLPLLPADRDILTGAIEKLQSRLVDQRHSLRQSFNALTGAIILALLASLLWSAWLWHGYRLNSVEALWIQKSMRKALYAEEETRKRISRDLHDDAIQEIAAARMICDRAAAATGGLGAKELSAEASAILAETGKKLRNLSHDLRPPDLERSGLIPALESLCERNKRVFGKEIRFLAAERLLRLSDEAALQTYRIVQEALTNAIKHAGQNRIELSIEPAYRSGGGGLLILVEDKADEEPTGTLLASVQPLSPSIWGGLGMAIMRERASYIGAQVELQQRRDGLRVSIFVPVDDTGGNIHV